MKNKQFLFLGTKIKTHSFYRHLKHIYSKSFSPCDWSMARTIEQMMPKLFYNNNNIMRVTFWPSQDSIVWNLLTALTVLLTQSCHFRSKKSKKEKSQLEIRHTNFPRKWSMQKKRVTLAHAGRRFEENDGNIETNKKS